MDMRISLKASQYMMFRRTKVHGKTILDTRSWKSTISFDDDVKDEDDHNDDEDEDDNEAYNANRPFSSSFHDFFGVNPSSLLCFSPLQKVLIFKFKKFQCKSNI